jgi:hypothetical protein
MLELLLLEAGIKSGVGMRECVRREGGVMHFNTI